MNSNDVYLHDYCSNDLNLYKFTWTWIIFGVFFRRSFGVGTWMQILLVWVFLANLNGQHVGMLFALLHRGNTHQPPMNEYYKHPTLNITKTMPSSITILLCICSLRITFTSLTIGATLRVCLFGGEIGWMENFGKKMGRKTFLECVWLDGEEGK